MDFELGTHGAGIKKDEGIGQCDGVVLSKENDTFNTHRCYRLTGTSIAHIAGTVGLPMIMGTAQGTRVLSGKAVCGTAVGGTLG